MTKKAVNQEGGDVVEDEVAPVAVADTPVVPDAVAAEPASDQAVAAQLVAAQPEKCPYCASTIFQGPFIRGPIINGQVVETERVYQCMGCNQVMNLERIRKPI